MPQFIYTMSKVRKAHGDKVILDDVTLAFYPGAKIGVVGPNGAGKCSVLKIMAGLDQPSNGDAMLEKGSSVGLLEQEPTLDATKDVRGNVEDGVREIRDVMRRYEELNEKMGAPDADFDAILAEQGPLLDAIEAANAWELDSQLEQAMDALRLPPADADVTVLSGVSDAGSRCAGCCSARRTCCCSTSRLTTSTPSPSSGSSSTWPPTRAQCSR